MASLQAQLGTTLSTVDYKMLLLHRRLAAVELHLNIANPPMPLPHHHHHPAGALDAAQGAHGGGAGGEADAHQHHPRASFDEVPVGSGGGVGPLGPAVSTGGHFRRDSTLEPPDHHLLLPSPFSATGGGSGGVGAPSRASAPSMSVSGANELIGGESSAPSSAAAAMGMGLAEGSSSSSSGGGSGGVAGTGPLHALMGSPVFGAVPHAGGTFPGVPLSIAPAATLVPTQAAAGNPPTPRGSLQPTGVMSWQDSAGQQQVVMYRLAAAAPPATTPGPSTAIAAASSVLTAALPAGAAGSSVPTAAAGGNGPDASAAATQAAAGAAVGADGNGAAPTAAGAAAPVATLATPLIRGSSAPAGGPSSSSAAATGPNSGGASHMAAARHPSIYGAAAYAGGGDLATSAASAAKDMMQQGPPSVYDSLFVVGTTPMGPAGGASSAAAVAEGLGASLPAAFVGGIVAGHDGGGGGLARPRSASFGAGNPSGAKRRYSVAAEDFTIDASYDAGAAAASKRMRSFSAFSSGSNFFSAHPPYMPGSSPFDEDGEGGRGGGGGGGMGGLDDDDDEDDEDEDGMHTGAGHMPPPPQASAHRYGTRGVAHVRSSMDERGDDLLRSGGSGGGGRPRSNSRVSIGKGGGGGGASLLSQGGGGGPGGSGGGGRARTMSRGGAGVLSDGLPAAPHLPGAGPYADGGGSAQAPLRGVAREGSSGALTDLDTDEHVADALAMLGAAAVGPLDSARSVARSPGGGGLRPPDASGLVSATSVMASGVCSDSDSEEDGERSL